MSQTTTGLSPVGLAALYANPGTQYLPVQQSSPHITYLFTDLYSGVICDLPLTGVTFSYKLNDAGTFTGTLNVEDPKVIRKPWIEGTAPNKTLVWVLVNGVAVWGGIVQQRSYTMSSQQVQIQGSDFWQYMNQRVQTIDYTNTWATEPGAGSLTMAQQIISDALAAANSIPIGLIVDGTVPSEYFIVASFPQSQTQQLGGLIQQLQTLGFNVGFDFASDVTTVEGTPLPLITLSYPRRGRVAGTTGLVIDIAQAQEFTWPEDGTQQADQVWEMATATGGVGSSGQWDTAMSVDGYPLLQAVESHMVFSATTYYTNSEVSSSQAVLNAWSADDLARYAYPAVAPTVTLPLFSPTLSLGDFIVGDDTRVIVPTQAGTVLPANPRFPKGLDTYLRIVECNVTVSDEGLSTMTLTLNMPPSSTPQRPPE